MLAPFLWYFWVLISGWVLFPVLFHNMPRLADRGFAFSRILALLLWGFAFWWLVSLGLLKNDSPGILIVFGLLCISGLITLKKSGVHEITQWIRQQKGHIIAVEILFLLSFSAWVYIRATNPEALGTEKPMELAFINAILRSPSFPPNDPWLSGYAISYYYFGYIVIGMLAKLTGVGGGVAFNLGIALVFALSAVGVYGLVFNALRSQDPEPNHVNQQQWLSLLGPFFVLISSNLEGFLHALHNRGVFWLRSPSGGLDSVFWRWLDIQDLNLPPSGTFSWFPDKFWWWWRASRVVQDYDLLGNPREIIDEFPFFSFLLADLHPHVLAMPFAFLVLGLALHIFLDKDPARIIRLGPLRLALSPLEFILTAIAVGALGFLNTWDLPIYVAVVAGSYAIRQQLSQNGKRGFSRLTTWLVDFIILGACLGIAGVLLYLPFYQGFSSQAGGLLVNFIYPTRGAHLWVMFGVLFLSMGCYLIFRLWNTRKSNSQSNNSVFHFTTGLWVTLVIVLGLWVLSLLMGALALLKEPLRSFYLTSLAASEPGMLITEGIIRRLTNPGGWLTISLFAAMGITLLIRLLKRADTSDKKTPPVELFILICLLVGGLLILMPEFFFLRDQFGWRMNTIFKFYFQAWLLFSTVAAFGTAWMLQKIKGGWGIVYRISLVGLLFVSLVYPLLGLPVKTNGFQPSIWGFDAGKYLASQNPDEMAAIEWLKTAPFGVISEAVSPSGGSYTGFARVSTLSGLPTVLGWIGHESQWRGGGKEIGNRQADVTRLYCARDPNDLQSIIDLYNIRYVIIGSLERTTYIRGSEDCPTGLNEHLLRTSLNPVFESGNTVILSGRGK